MMKYRIKIEVLTETPEAKYPTYRDVYEQEVDELDVQAVIAVVNKLDRP